MCEFCSPDPKIECCVCGRKAKKTVEKPQKPLILKMKRYNPGLIRSMLGWFTKVYR